MIRVGLLGGRGRMGQWVIRLLNSEFSSLATLIAQANQGDPLEPLLGADVIIDFSSPAGMCALSTLALKRTESLPALVVGSTGWNPQERKILEEVSSKTPVLVASNFSTGVYAIFEMLKHFSPFLERLGYTPVILEAHHKNKKDAPSGTALSLRRAIDVHDPSRIQTHSVRAGEVIGDHEISFYGTADKITIGHFAQNRSIFARGAIETALWLAGKRAGPHALRGTLGIEHYFEAIRLQGV